MLIASKNKEQIINADTVCSIFIGGDSGKRIMAMTENKNIIVDTYETKEDSLMAMEILTERLRIATESTTVCFMPTDQQVKARRNSTHQDIIHLKGGRKQKGYGGS